VVRPAPVGDDADIDTEEVMMELRELMSGEIEKVDSNVTVFDAATQMEEAGVGSLAVLEEDEFRGIFTERDILKVVAAAEEPAVETVGSWMTPYPDSFSPDMDVRDAANWMLAAGYRHLPVVDDGRLIGMASIKDILWALTGDSVG
jgi:CBS domain-containing protein